MAFFKKSYGGNTMFTANDSGNHTRQRKSFKQTLSSYWDPGVFLIAAFLVTAFTLVLLSIIFPTQAESSMLPQSETYMKPSEVREGRLLFESVKSGQYVPAPQLNTDVRIEILICVYRAVGAEISSRL